MKCEKLTSLSAGALAEKEREQGLLGLFRPEKQLPSEESVLQPAI